MGARRFLVGMLAVTMVVGPVSASAASDRPVADASSVASSERTTARHEEVPIKDTTDFPIGVAVDPRETRGAAASLLVTHFDQITAENHMKPEAWYDEDAQFRFHPEAKALVDFASAQGLSVYGHTLVWDEQNPDWFFLDSTGTPLTGSRADQQFLIDRLRTHIFSVAETFRNVYGEFGTDGNPIRAFDVVNEAVADEAGTEGGLRESEWQRILGEQYIDLAFRFADEAFNETFAAAGAEQAVTLFINDYDTEQADKRERLHALVERLLARGAPVDGVGHQFHTAISTPVGDLESALVAFDDLDVIQAVTELDVATGIPVDDASLEAQGTYYRDAFRIFRARADPLFSVTLWGLTDDRSWRIAEGAPLAFTERLDAKPAYFGIIEGSRPAPEDGGSAIPGDSSEGDSLPDDATDGLAATGNSTNGPAVALLFGGALVLLAAGGSALVIRRRRGLPPSSD